jgi:hypothetical protein
MKKNPSIQITEQDIQRALRQFKLAGGKITRIPDQVTPRLRPVRPRLESLSGLPYVVETEGAAAPPISGE